MDRLDKIEELLNMAAAQTADTAIKQDKWAKEFRDSLRLSRREHDKDMKEIRALLKTMIKRVAV